MDVRRLSEDMLKLVKTVMKGVAAELCREVSDGKNIMVEELPDGVWAFCRNVKVFVTLGRERNANFSAESLGSITLTVSLKATIQSVEDESAQLIKDFAESSSQ